MLETAIISECLWIEPRILGTDLRKLLFLFTLTARLLSTDNRVTDVIFVMVIAYFNTLHTGNLDLLG